MSQRAALPTAVVFVSALAACGGPSVEVTSTEGTESATVTGGGETESGASGETSGPSSGSGGESTGTEGTTTTGGGTTTGGTDTTGGTVATTESSGESTDSASTDSESTDSETRGGTDTDDIVCTKVDVIFAVDNSGSMQDEIDALQGPVFDSLPDSLLQVGNGIDDFNLGVINGCPKPGYLFDQGDDGACNYSTNANYMSSTSPDLDGEYACVMTMSDEGYMGMAQACEDSGDLGDDDEQPASAAAAVLSPANLEGNNAGFLRDDALLFIVAMTDEDEELIDAQGDDVAPSTIVDQIVASKGAIENVVMLGIGGASNCNGPYGSANDAANLQSITQIFADADRGLFWDLCQGDLETAFEQALVIVDEACFDLVPQ